LLSDYSTYPFGFIRSGATRLASFLGVQLTACMEVPVVKRWQKTALWRLFSVPSTAPQTLTPDRFNHFLDPRAHCFEPRPQAVFHAFDTIRSEATYSGSSTFCLQNGTSPDLTHGSWLAMHISDGAPASFALVSPVIVLSLSSDVYFLSRQSLTSCHGDSIIATLT
jgi:hypothetical protein